MKHLKSLCVALVLFVGATGFVQAQDVAKTAHIDTQKLVEAMPSMVAAQNQLKKLQATYDAEIKTMAQEWEAKMKQYNAEAESKTDDENIRRSKEVQDMQKKIQEYQQNALKDLQQKEVDLMTPLLEKARAAIQKVARAQGYQYVLDCAVGNGVILCDGPDLLDAVKKEMGI